MCASWYYLGSSTVDFGAVIEVGSATGNAVSGLHELRRALVARAAGADAEYVDLLAADEWPSAAVEPGAERLVVGAVFFDHVAPSGAVVERVRVAPGHRQRVDV